MTDQEIDQFLAACLRGTTNLMEALDKVTEQFEKTANRINNQLDDLDKTIGEES